MPFNLIYSAKAYYEAPQISFNKINFPIEGKAGMLQVILVLGETVRSDHLGLNGYRRNTTPQLSQRSDVVSFRNIFTNKTYTAISVPQILSDQSVQDSTDTQFFSLVDVLNAAKIQTAWIGNQTPETSYEHFITASKQRKLIDPDHSEFSFHKAFDKDLLKNFDHDFLPNTKQFLIYHMMGSHWFYENRYPETFRIFKPVITSKYVHANTTQEMVNSYDNTILYLDDFFSTLIRNIEKSGSNTVVIYLSDDGEALGENGNFFMLRNRPRSKIRRRSSGFPQNSAHRIREYLKN